jgi:hypothetical protein
MVEHGVILQMLQAKGFSAKWISWIRSILSSDTSQVLLNGVPGKPIKCRRGVRQGDPLSPLIVGLADDLLQSIVNKAYNMNLLNHPLSKVFGQDYPIIQYADDTLIILPAEALQLFTLKGLLRSFTGSIGLKVNYSKSFLVPINVNNDKAMHLASTMGCQVGTLPFTYLSLPLGTTRPSIEDFAPLLARMEKRIMDLNKLLSYQGRLIFVNSVLSALPTFFLCTFKVPISILEQDKYKKMGFGTEGILTEKRDV